MDGLVDAGPRWIPISILTESVGEISVVNCAHAFQLKLHRLGDAIGEYRDSVVTPLAVTNDEPILVGVNVLHAQLQTLLQAQARAVQQVRHQPSNTVQAREQRSPHPAKARPEAEPDVELEVEELPGAEMIDDPVRMYLREIGRVNLLTAKEERTLARKMESGKYIERLEKDFREQTGRPPQATEIVKTRLWRLCQAAPLIGALGEKLGISSNPTLSQLISHPTVRDAIDGEINLELMEEVAAAAGMGRRPCLVVTEAAVA